MVPLKELAAGSNPILDTSQVVKLFGPVELLLQIHELFYTALCMRAKDWSSKSLIGDVFLSSVSCSCFKTVSINLSFSLIAEKSRSITPTMSTTLQKL